MAKQTYEVCGVQPVLGNAPGSEFDADLPPEQRAFLIEVGAIRPKKPESGSTRAKDNKKE